MDDFEIGNIGEGGESGEVTADAVEKFKAQVRASQTQQAQAQATEKKVTAQDHTTANLMIQIMQDADDDTLVILMAHALSEDIPAPMVLSTVSLLFPDIMKKLEKVEITLFEDRSVNEEQNQEIILWEKTLIASMEHTLTNFGKAYKKHDGNLVNFSRLIEYVLEKKYGSAYVSGGQVLQALFHLIKHNI